MEKDRRLRFFDSSRENRRSRSFNERTRSHSEPKINFRRSALSMKNQKIVFARDGNTSSIVDYE